MDWRGLGFAGLGLVLGFASIALIPDDRFFRQATTSDGGSIGGRWACPMLDFIGTKPGACPVCGMQLQRVESGTLTSEQARRMGVELATVTEGPAMVTIHAYGAARYDDRTEQAVIARVAGRIVRRFGGALHPGLDVAVGDPLVDLYSTEVYAAQRELSVALRNHDQPLIELITKRFAGWNLDHVAAAIMAGGQPVDVVSLRSPFAGRVVLDEATAKDGMVKVGAEIRADEPLVRLVDPTAFMVIVHVPEARARLIRPGQRVALASDDAGDLPDVDASVSWIAPELDAVIRARAVHLHLDDPHHRLLPGSLVHARFQAVLGPDLTPADPDDRRTWGSFPLIPASAVLSTGVRSVAWKLASTDNAGQRFAIAPLALGQRIEAADGKDVYVVRAGLSIGDQVATQGAFLIDSQAQLAGSPSLLFPLGAAAPVPAHQH